MSRGISEGQTKGKIFKGDYSRSSSFILSKRDKDSIVVQNVYSSSFDKI